ATREEDLSGARPGFGRGRGGPDRGADRSRPEAPHEDGGHAGRTTVGDRLPSPGAIRRLDVARARPGDRPDPPDPGPPRCDRPPGRGRPRVRHGDLATRTRGTRPAVPPRLAARADGAIRRPPHPGHGAAAAGADRRPRPIARGRAVTDGLGSDGMSAANGAMLVIISG